MRHQRSASFGTAILLAVAAASPATAAEPSPAIQQCWTLLSTGKHAEAAAPCSQAGNESIEGKLLHGDYLANTGDERGAVKRYSEILEGYDRSQPTGIQLAALKRRAYLWFDLKNAREAASDAEAYLEHKPNDVEMLQVAAMTHPTPLTRVRYLDTLIAQEPNAANLHAHRAHALVYAGQGKEALASAETALKLDPQMDIALTARGLSYALLGEHEKAERDYATVAARRPTDPEPRANRSKALLALGRVPEALKAAEEALALKPTHVGGLLMRSQARLRMGDPEGAIADLRAAQLNAPGDGLDTRRAIAEANLLIKVQKSLQPESIKQFEADQQRWLQYVRSHLFENCGQYQQAPYYKDREARYACIMRWYDEEEARYELNPDGEIRVLTRRMDEKGRLIEMGESFVCSKMPQGSRCIDDGLYSRAIATREDMLDPKYVIGMAELNQMNAAAQAEARAANAALKRKNALIKTATFLQALADELTNMRQSQ
jgi:tetratricopeptide (TPR) repeat protein